MPRKTAQNKRVNKPKPEPAQLKALEKLFEAKDYRTIVKRVRPLIARFPDHGGARRLPDERCRALLSDAEWQALPARVRRRGGIQLPSRLGPVSGALGRRGVRVAPVSRPRGRRSRRCWVKGSPLAGRPILQVAAR